MELLRFAIVWFGFSVMVSSICSGIFDLLKLRKEGRTVIKVIRFGSQCHIELERASEEDMEQVIKAVTQGAVHCTISGDEN